MAVARARGRGGPGAGEPGGLRRQRGGRGRRCRSEVPDTSSGTPRPGQLASRPRPDGTRVRTGSGPSARTTLASVRGPAGCRSGGVLRRGARHLADGIHRSGGALGGTKPGRRCRCEVPDTLLRGVTRVGLSPGASGFALDLRRARSGPEPLQRVASTEPSRSGCRFCTWSDASGAQGEVPPRPRSSPERRGPRRPAGTASTPGPVPARVSSTQTALHSLSSRPMCPPGHGEPSPRCGLIARTRPHGPPLGTAMTPVAGPLEGPTVRSGSLLQASVRPAA